MPLPLHAYTQQLIQYLENNQRDLAYRWLLQNEASYAQQFDYNEWLARLAMQYHDYTEAITALERLILLQPEHLGAQLDLTIAYYKAGYHSKARQQLASLQSRLQTIEPVPANAQRAIEQLQQQLQLKHDTYRVRGLLEQGLGYDSNVNLGIDSSTVDLNIGGEFPFRLELGSESIASGGSFDEQQIQLAIEESVDNCYFAQWCTSAIANINTRQYHQLDRYNQQQYLLGLSVAQRQRQHQQQWLVYWQHAQLSDFDRHALLALDYSYQQRVQDRWWGASVHLDHRYDNKGELPASQQISVSLYNYLHRIPGQAEIKYSASIAYHRQPKRQAGDAWQAQILVNYRRPMQQWLLQASAGVYWRRDTQAYSQLLFGDVHRQELAVVVDAGATRQLSARWSANIKASYKYNEASIPLLDHDRGEISTAIRYQW